MCGLQKARKVRKETRFETRDEKEALEYYKMMKAGRKRKAEEEGESGEEGESEEEGAAETKEGNVGDEDMEETEEKRGITYQVSNFFKLILERVCRNVAFVSICFYRS